MELLTNEWIALPLFGLAVFTVFYIWSDKILIQLYNKSISKRTQVMKHMDLLGMDAEEKKVTRILLMSSFGIGTFFFFLMWPNMAVGAFLGVSSAIAGFQLIPLVYQILYERRCDRFVEQMVDALTIMGNGIKSGSNAPQSMQRVIEIMDNPIKAEFSRVISQTQLGQTFEDALLDLSERIPRQDVVMFVTAINILKETGGNLAETFTTIVATIRDRQKLEKKISAMTAQGVTQGVIVTSIPFILGAVFYFMDPAYMKPMFNTTLGLVLLVAMLGLQIIGGFMIKKIVTIKV